jgi:hypothetical protein
VDRATRQTATMCDWADSRRRGAHAQLCSVWDDVGAVAKLCLEAVLGICGIRLLKFVVDSRELGGTVGLDVGLAEEDRAVHVEVVLEHPAARGCRDRLRQVARSPMEKICVQQHACQP